MAEEHVDRRLAAIFAADVAGYSRLMGRDEEGTHAALKIVRQSFFDPKIKQHRGRIVKSTGDGALVEFASAVDAVRCAIDIQRGMIARNKDIPTDRRIEFRIGINIGDIIPDEADIYGDGVNIATRLEGLARPNGLCISSQVYDQFEGRIPVTFKSLGPQSLKNIDKHVEAFALDIDHDFQNADAHQIALTQEINYCRAPDQVRLAWAKAGRGPAFVRTANWLNHLEYDWQNPLGRAALQNLARRHTLIRYDARGNCQKFLSMRGSVILRRWLMLPDWSVFLCSAFRRVAQSRLHMPFGILTVSHVSSCMVDLRSAATSAAPKNENNGKQ
jgi:class 3 adenylate cyclase